MSRRYKWDLVIEFIDFSWTAGSMLKTYGMSDIENIFHRTCNSCRVCCCCAMILELTAFMFEWHSLQPFWSHSFFPLPLRQVEPIFICLLWLIRYKPIWKEASAVFALFSHLYKCSDPWGLKLIGIYLSLLANIYNNESPNEATLVPRMRALSVAY